jgi:hypothetical protein
LKWKVLVFLCPFEMVYAHLVYFIAIWYVYWGVILYILWSFVIHISWSFGIFHGHFVYFVVIWCILQCFGMLPPKIWQMWSGTFFKYIYHHTYICRPWRN